MNTLSICKYLLLLPIVILAGCDTVSPDYLSLTEAELRSYTHCKVSFQCELVNCAVGKEPFQYKWEQDTMSYVIQWDSVGFNAQQKFSNSGPGTYDYYSESKTIRACFSGNNITIDSMILMHHLGRSYHSQHLINDYTQEDYAQCVDIELAKKTQDSVVYFAELNLNHNKLDSASYSNEGHYNIYIGGTLTCGISWQNNAKSYIRLVLFKK